MAILVDELLEKIRKTPSAVQFAEVISTIDVHYRYTATKFTNGDLESAAGTNEGSCKIFAFGHLNGLTEEQTLHCFGDYYRVDVLANPHATDHANIRAFIAEGWEGIQYFGTPLTPMF